MVNAFLPKRHVFSKDILPSISCREVKFDLLFTPEERERILEVRKRAIPSREGDGVKLSVVKAELDEKTSSISLDVGSIRFSELYGLLASGTRSPEVLFQRKGIRPFMLKNLLITTGGGQPQVLFSVRSGSHTTPLNAFVDRLDLSTAGSLVEAVQRRELGEEYGIPTLKGARTWVLSVHNGSSEVGGIGNFPAAFSVLSVILLPHSSSEVLMLQKTAADSHENKCLGQIPHEERKLREFIQGLPRRDVLAQALDIWLKFGGMDLVSSSRA